MPGAMFSLELLSRSTGSAFVFRSADEALVRAELDKVRAKPGSHYRARLWRTGGAAGPACLEDVRLDR